MRCANQSIIIPLVSGGNPKSDAVVVGGGVTGCAAAYFLARKGLAVTVIERHDLNTQASGRNAGGLHGQIQHEPFFERGEDWARAFGPSLALMHRSIGIWQELEKELAVDLEVSMCGGLIVAENEAQLRDLERKARIDREFGNDVELLGANELRSVAPYVSRRMAGGLFCRNEGKANPLLAAPALAHAAASAGARFLLHTDLSAIEPRKSGYRLTTSAGIIDCEKIADCAGAAAGEISGLIGIPLPVESHPIQVAVTEVVPPLVKHLVYFAGGRLTLKQARYGSLLIGGGWPARVDSAGTRLLIDLPGLGKNLQEAIDVVPKVATSSLLRTWAGVCPGLEDQRPVVGELAPGFVVSMFPFLGFTCGPIMGWLAAALLLGDDPNFDLAPFAPSRLL